MAKRRRNAEKVIDKKASGSANTGKIAANEMVEDGEKSAVELAPEVAETTGAKRTKRKTRKKSGRKDIRKDVLFLITLLVLGSGFLSVGIWGIVFARANSSPEVRRGVEAGEVYVVDAFSVVRMEGRKPIVSIYTSDVVGNGFLFLPKNFGDENVAVLEKAKEDGTLDEKFLVFNKTKYLNYRGLKKWQGREWMVYSTEQTFPRKEVEIIPPEPIDGASLNVPK